MAIPAKYLWSLVVLIGLSWTVSAAPDRVTYNLACEQFVEPERANCTPKSQVLTFTIDGLFCSLYRPTANRCKAFSGRYEFEFDLRNGHHIRTSEDPVRVDFYGYLKRVPLSYTMEGAILYADQAINSAREVVREQQIVVESLLVSNWTWCHPDHLHAWPYKSVIRDRERPGDKMFFIYNQQVCHADFERRIFRLQPKIIVNGSESLHRDALLVEHAMPERGTMLYVRGSVFQWADFSLVNDLFTVKLDPKKRFLLSPQLLELNEKCYDENLSSEMYSYCGVAAPQTADMDFYTNREHHSPNSDKEPIDKYLFVRRPIARTSEPVANTSFRQTAYVLHHRPTDVALSSFRYELATNLDQTTNKLRPVEPEDWTVKGNVTQLVVRQVPDDIAILPKCSLTIIVLGAYYQTLKTSELLVPGSKGPVDSIYALGAYELIQALYVNHERDELWMYHRANFISTSTYLCRGSQVVAARKSPEYFYRRGPNMLYHGPYADSYAPRYNFQEELSWVNLKLTHILPTFSPAEDPEKYRGGVTSPKPNWPTLPPPEPASSALPALIVVTMIIFIFVVSGIVGYMIYLRIQAQQGAPYSPDNDIISDGSVLNVTLRKSPRSRVGSRVNGSKIKSQQQSKA